jgi:hypothetical protein
MRKASHIQRLLANWCRGNQSEIILPSFFYGDYEMDVFRLMPSGVIVEYEIKISRSDFRADFKKSTTIWPEGWASDMVAGREFETKSVLKHDTIAEGKGSCNRFYFVVPAGLVKPEELPKHAGLIYYHANHESFEVIKNAPLIKGPKMDTDKYKSLAVSLSWREQNLRMQLRNLKVKIK